METNDSNIRPQQTGGLKLMTVFIAVLALHVVVIGGFTVYHLMSGGGTDMDTLTDKTHKNAKIAADGSTSGDGALPETSSSTASASSTSNVEAPTAEQPASTESTTATSTAANPKPTVPARSGPVFDPAPASAPAPATAATTEPAPTPAYEPAPLLSGTPYVVKAHDSLARIAHQNHTSVAKLKTANSLNSDMLHIGQKLVIPAHAQVAAGSVPATSQDASGSTTILGNSASTPSMTIPASTPTAAPTAVTMHEPAAAAPAMTGHHLYTVMKGDTLTKIAHKFKTTPTAIMTANNITDPAKLSVGKKLKIPGQEARSATTTEPPAASQPSQVQTKPATTAQLANFLQ